MPDPEPDAPAPPKKARKAKVEVPAPQELPTEAAIRKARKADLVKWLGELGEKTEGRVADLRGRLLEHVKDQEKPPTEGAPAVAEKTEGLPEETPVAAPEGIQPAPEEAPVEAVEEPKKPKAAEKPKKAEEETPRFAAKAKPALDDATRLALGVRRAVAARRPRFLRQEWYRYVRLGETWRRPQGGQSKLRRHFGYRINVVSIGYRSPRRSRGLHPSGFVEVLVHTPRQLDGADPKRQAIRVAHGVGARKRRIIQDEAKKRGLRVLNPVEVEE